MSSLYEEYLDWFKQQWFCLPDKEYAGGTFLDKMISLREDPAMANNKEFQEKVKILTFEEYKNGIQEKHTKTRNYR